MLEIISLFLGGILRLVPEVFAWVNKKTDNAHELAMMDKQVELQNGKIAGELSHTQLQGDFSHALAVMNLHAEALKGQMQKVGNPVIDGLNFLVRPLTTYYFLLLYGTFKLGLIITGAMGEVPFWTVMVSVYDDQDRQALWGILGFWFVGRTFEKRNG